MKQFIVSKFLNFFSSIQLAIILIITIALYSIVGTLIPQGLPVREYHELFGLEKTKLIINFHLDDVYHSWIFILLLCCLALNLTACTWKRRFSRRGPLLTHISILLILLGGTVGAKWGFKGTLIIPEGETADSFSLRRSQEIRPLGFSLKLNRFVLEKYPDGTPKEYRSEISVLDHQGAIIQNAQIRVNHPFTHQGITFYQSTYGTIYKLNLKVRNLQNGELSSVETDLKTPFPLPGSTDYQGMVLNFKENLVIPPQMKAMTDFPQEQMGPSAQIAILTQGGVEKTLWIFEKFPEFNAGKSEMFHFTLAGHRPIPYTGLEISRDPGTNIVWIGFALLTGGIILSFLERKKKTLSAQKGK